MISFMFSILGSVFFWIAFFILGFFAVSLLLKRMAPNTIEYITTGRKPLKFHPVDSFLVIIGLFIGWPIVLLLIFIRYIVIILFGKILWPIFCAGVKKVISITPGVNIEKKA